VVERPDGVEYRRIVTQDQGLGGRSLDVPIVLLGADRHLAREGLHRSEGAGDRARRASWSRTMCRTGWSSNSSPTASRSSPQRPAEITLDGRFPLRRAGLRLASKAS
jgi:alpha-2-macroglobulin